MHIRSMQTVLSSVFLLCVSHVSVASDATNRMTFDEGGAWPKICTGHPYAVSATATAVDDDAGEACTLVFPYFSRPDERLELCKDMFSDNVRSFSGDDFSTTCFYDRTYRCEQGFTLVRSQCYRLSLEADSFTNAKAKCSSAGGSLASDLHKEDLRYLFYLVNPVKYNLDVRAIWTSQNEQFIMRRGVDLPALPGQIVKAYMDKAHSYCVKNVIRSRIAYKRYCEVLKNSFKLTTHFQEGSCFMLSPSMSVDHGINPVDTISQKELNFRHFHSRCKWISKDDYSATPITPIRREGIVNLLKSRKRDTLIILPGFRVKEDSFYLMNKHLNGSKIETEEITAGAFMFPLGEPKTTDGRKTTYKTSSKEDYDSSATSLAMGVGPSFDQRSVQSMPEYFRSHRVCMSGVSRDEMPFKSCNDKSSGNPHLQNGWKPILRDNGKVMCVKAFIKDLNENDPAKSVNYQCLDFAASAKVCKDVGGVLTPIQSHEEQSLVQDVLKARLLEIQDFEKKHGVPDSQKTLKDGSVWLGAKKVVEADPPRKESFAWIYDNKPLQFSNFDQVDLNEPNNAGGRERCRQMYTDQGVKYMWNDIPCDWTCQHHGNRYKMNGFVCARFL